MSNKVGSLKSVMLQDPFFASLGTAIGGVALGGAAYFLAPDSLAAIPLPMPLLAAAYGLTLAGIAKYIGAGGAVDDSKYDLTGKFSIVTGANTGMGYEAALVLAARGCDVIMACRSKQRGDDAVNRIKSKLQGKGGKVELMLLDLGDSRSIRNFVAEFLKLDRKLDILMNNAGVMLMPYKHTQDGHESHVGINHLGHFLLTYLLLDKIKQDGTKVVTVSSAAHATGNPTKCTLTEMATVPEAKYDQNIAYGNSKFGNVMMTKHLNHLLEESNSAARAYTCHPGMCMTDLARELPKAVQLMFAPLAVCLKNPKQGAQSQLYCALSEEAVPGVYIADCSAKVYATPPTFDAELAARWWDESKVLCKL